MRKLLAITCLLLPAAVVRAELCDGCKGGTFIMSVGTCEECGARTSSGSKRLCPACSKGFGQCEVCRKKLGGGPQQPTEGEANADPGAKLRGELNDLRARRDAAQAKLEAFSKRFGDTHPSVQKARGELAEATKALDACKAKFKAAGLEVPPAEPGRIDTARSGSYAWDKWRYEYAIRHAGTRSEKRAGTLTHDGEAPVEEPKPGDLVLTPWGLMQFHGSGYARGWLYRGTYDACPDLRRSKWRESPDDELAAPVVKHYKALRRRAMWTKVHLLPSNAANADAPGVVFYVKGAAKPKTDQPTEALSREQMKSLIDHLMASSVLLFAKPVSPTKYTPGDDAGYAVLYADGREARLAGLGGGGLSRMWMHAAAKALKGNHDAQQRVLKIARSLENSAPRK